MATPAAPSLSPAMLSEILALPATTPPPGVTSTFVNRPNDATVSIVFATIFMSIAVISVFIRMWTKAVIMRQMFVEDYLLFGGLCLFLGENVPALTALKYGNGAHMWDVSLGDFENTLHTNNLSMILYSVTTLLVKLSILLQFLRIFVPSKENNRFIFYTIWATMVGNTIYYLSMLGFLIGLCSPREKIWNLFITTGSCFNLYLILEVSGVLNIVSDCIIVAIPLSCVWRLKMQRSKKIAVSSVFAIGFLAIVASTARCYYSFDVSTTDDVTYVTSFLGIWAAAECALGVLVASAPVFPRFYDSISPKVYYLLSSSTRRNQSLSSGSGDSATRVKPNSGRSFSNFGAKRSKRSPWNDSLFSSDEKDAVVSVSRSDHELSEGQERHTSLHNMTPVRPLDLERAEGGNIWRTVSVDVETRPVPPK